MLPWLQRCAIAALVAIVSWARASELQEALQEVMQLWRGEGGLEENTGNAYVRPRRQGRCSSVKTLCEHLSGERQLGCCKPSTTRYVYNAKLEKGGIVLYSGDGACGNTLPDKLTTLQSVLFRKQYPFTLRVSRRDGGKSFDSDCDGKVFNGTLHVQGTFTPNNLFHVMNDNLLGLLSHVVTDVHFEREFALLPRLRLAGWQPGAKGSEAAHYSILKDIMPELALGAAQADGMCFRRIVWGDGPRLLYNHNLVLLRRQATDLMRALVKRTHRPPLPEEFVSPPRGAINSTLARERDLRRIYNLNAKQVFSEIKLVDSSNNPLKIVIFTRGDSGLGRSLPGEVLLARGLRALGALVAICCKFDQVGLSQQLGYGFHADAVVGLHGAGLANALLARRGSFTVELKSSYGYSTDLFALCSDARRGVFLQVDIRRYGYSGGHRSVDEGLVLRVARGLYVALLAGGSLEGRLRELPGGDLALGALAAGSNASVVGPPVSQAAVLCRESAYARLWRAIGADVKVFCAVSTC